MFAVMDSPSVPRRWQRTTTPCNWRATCGQDAVDRRQPFKMTLELPACSLYRARPAPRASHGAAPDNRDICVRHILSERRVLAAAILMSCLFAGCRVGPAPSIPDTQAEADPAPHSEGAEPAAPALRQVDRQPEVRAPDEMIIATVQLVDAAAIGLLQETPAGRVLTLGQSPCRFEEAEPDASFTADDALGCRAYAYEMLPSRTHRALRIPPGPLRIAVENRTVAHEVGIWLRRESDGALVASAGGAGTGAAISVQVDLAPGRYLYSCALNPTPAYLLVVEER